MIIGINGYAKSGKDTFANIWNNLAQGFTADDIIGHLEENDNFTINPYMLNIWEVKKWAKKLKQFASVLTGISEYEFEKQQVKDSFLPEQWDYYQIEAAWPDGDIRLYTNTRFISEKDAFSYLHSRGRTFNGYYDLKTKRIRMTVRQFLQELGTDAIRNGLHPNTWVNALMHEYEPNKGSNWLISDTRFPNEAEAIKKCDGLVIRINRKNVKPINAHESETALDNWNFDYTIENNKGLKTFVANVENLFNQIKLDEHNKKTACADTQKQNQPLQA
jgi:hypothetical protein